ncbi:MULTISPECIES: hypothetical protein [unclassified Endozoicomonas]|uniref:hypothetical protein n=1 Tax=Endozoicomonas TaxID=305899 RepID=UPI003BB6C0E5
MSDTAVAVTGNSPNLPSSELITEEQLMLWSKFKRQADLLNFLQINNIVYFRGRGGSICTTLNAINHCLHNNNQNGQAWG